MADEIPISKRIVLVNSVSSIAARILNVSVLIWLQQYLLDRISAAEYSLYPVVVSVIVFVPLATSILTSGIARYAVEAKAAGDRDRVTHIVSTMLPLLVGTAVLLLMLGGVFVWKIDSVLTVDPARIGEAQLMMGLLIASTAIRLPMIPFMSGFFITQKLVLSDLIRVGGEFLRIAILFVLLFGVSTRVMWVVVAAVVADVLRAFVSVSVSRRLVPELRFSPGSIRWELAREIVSFGSWRFVSQLADRLQNSADVLILNKLATPADVTSFHIGSLPRRQLSDAMAQASMTLVPPMTAMHARGKAADLRNVYLRGGRIAIWLSMLAAAPAIIFHREIIFLYLEGRYQQAGVVMMLLLASFPIGYGHIILPRLVTASANVKPFARRTLAAQIINVLLTLVLVGYFRLGAIGSAMATLIVAAVLNPLLVWPLGFRMANLTLATWARSAFWPGLVPTLVSLPIWLGIRWWIAPMSWLSLGLAAGAGMAAYVLSLYVIAMKKEDRTDLAKILTAIGTRLPRRNRTADRMTEYSGSETDR